MSGKIKLKPTVDMEDLRFKLSEDLNIPGISLGIAAILSLYAARKTKNVKLNQRVLQKDLMSK